MGFSFGTILGSEQKRYIRIKSSHQEITMLNDVSSLSSTPSLPASAIARIQATRQPCHPREGADLDEAINNAPWLNTPNLAKPIQPPRPTQLPLNPRKTNQPRHSGPTPATQPNLGNSSQPRQPKPTPALRTSYPKKPYPYLTTKSLTSYQNK